MLYLIPHDTILLVISCVLFVLYQLIAGMTFYHVFWIDHTKVVFTSNSWTSSRVSIRFLAYSFQFIFRVFLQPLAMLTCYLTLLFSKPVVFAANKGFDIGGIVQANSWQHILTFILLLICFLENIVVGLWTILYLNDYSILRAVIWSTNSWQSPILEFIIKLYIPISFVYLASVRMEERNRRRTRTRWRR